MNRRFASGRYANVTATVALVVALSGTSYAAITLPKNSVGNRQLKSNAVTSGKVKNRTLLERDFKRGELPSGARGQTGAQGAKGDPGDPGAPGAPGAPGRSALTPLGAGETVRGVVGLEARAAAAGNVFATAASYPIPLAAAPTGAFIDGVTPGDPCTGTSDAPTAPAGTLCVYPFVALNPAVGISSHAIITTGTLGLRVAWATTAATDTRFHATWAVTGA